MLLSVPTVSFRGLSNPWIRRLAWWVIIQFSALFVLHQAFRQPIFGIQFSPWTLLPTLLFLTSLWMLEKLVRSTESEQQWVKLADTLCLTGFIIGLVGWADYFGFSQLIRVNPRWNAGSVPSLFGNTMVSMGYLGTLLPLYLIFKPLRYRLGFWFLTVLILLSGSAIGVVAGLMGVLTVLLLTRRYKLLGLTTLLSVGAFFYLLTTHPSFLSITQRPIIWTHVLQAWREVPYTGMGLGAVASRFGFEKQPDLYLPFNQVHNDYLQLLAEIGLIGVILGGLAIGWCLWRTLKEERSILQSGWLAVLASLAVVMVFSFPLEIAPCMMVGLFAWAGLESQLAEGG